MKFKRIIAFIIDVTIAGMFYSAFTSMMPDLFETQSVEIWGLNVKATLSLNIVFDLLYFLLFDILNKGTTIGRMIFKIAISYEESIDVPVSKLVARTLLKTISLIFFPIAALVFLFTDSFTLHDRVAETKVVDK